jgi:hypothetical protein
MIFETSNCSIEKKLQNFSKYVKRQSLARFLVYYELFKLQQNIKGSIVECGVHNGGGVMTWAKLSSSLEPINYSRKIIGFDTFSGFPSIDKKDESANPLASIGAFSELESYSPFEELQEVIKEYNANRFLNQIEKIELVKGDANLTIPKYIFQNQHLLISLLYLDFDIYEPTITALKHFLPRMPKGAIIAFDELNNPDWPGETTALIETMGLRNIKIECFSWEPNISYIIL